MVINGTGLGTGITIGYLMVYEDWNRQIIRGLTEQSDLEPSLEIERYRKACDDAVLQLSKLVEEASSNNQYDTADILDAQMLFAQDQELKNRVEAKVEELHVTAEYAVSLVTEEVAEQFAKMDNEYLKSRILDVRDFSNRIIRNLTGDVQEVRELERKTILFAEDIAPSDVLTIDAKQVSGVVLKYGSLHSHATMLFRELGIPIIMELQIASDVLKENAGKKMILDARSGKMILDPSSDELVFYEAQERELFAEQLKEQKALEEMECSGEQKIPVYANISGINDVATVLQGGAAGVGLFRTEYLYMMADHAPTEDEQVEIYQAIVAQMNGMPVIIRTLDVGADKQVPYLEMGEEANPAMGSRGIRYSLTHKDVIVPQLAAICRAAVAGNVKVMFPMVTSVDEVVAMKQILEEVKASLEEKSIAYGNPEIGIMIETPAAAILSDALAKEVDFFSIGTNDLTQFVLGVDRTNPRLEELYDSKHPAVLELVQSVIETANKNHVFVEICGELAADTSMTAKLIEMGVDALSVPPSKILAVRKAVYEKE